MHKIINISLFECAWLAAILVDYRLALVFIGVMLLHGLHYERGQHPYTKLFGFALLGILIDGALIHLTLMEPADGRGPSVLEMPIWLVTLWMGFSLTLCSSLSWLKKFPKLFIALCTIFGPLSYKGGAALDALYIEDPVYFLLAGIWCILSMFIIRLVGPDIKS